VYLPKRRGRASMLGSLAGWGMIGSGCAVAMMKATSLLEGGSHRSRAEGESLGVVMRSSLPSVH
jgi:hypothetical protein